MGIDTNRFNVCTVHQMPQSECFDFHRGLQPCECFYKEAGWDDRPRYVSGVTGKPVHVCGR